ncbi:DUF5677 domain-containing protein [Methylophaga muralis]|uniref:Uncharacterized protein n=1 Tax=Methylophaga muralis TaxID=291169 RepID=A0A1E3GMU1_9GAMM|nr:DUF5677 domain-containing protein [Methylophaga muralis]ODN65378.1 hypothetical protein A9E74_02823 [Methylophaga muralis]
MAENQYQTVETYRAAADALYAVTVMVLSSLAKYDCDTKNIIIRNFVARSAMTLKSVFSLWDKGDIQNAWIIHRALVDRMFHLHSLGVNDDFHAFDDWSFFEQYKSQNRVKSDDLFKDQAVGWEYQISEEQKARIKALEKNKPTWRRPRAEDVAKDMGMEFLYKYGYDYASTHVHPMANNGEKDFYAITKLQPSPRFPSQITVISNTILTSTLILQDSLNQSSFSWRRVLWDFIDDVRGLLRNGDVNYQKSFGKLTTLFKEHDL